MNYEKFGEAIALNDQQLLETVNHHMELIQPDAILEMIDDSADELLEKGSKELLEQASPLERIVLFALQLYKRGFISGLVLYNDALKEELKEMQQRKNDRLQKRKDWDRSAKA